MTSISNSNNLLLQNIKKKYVTHLACECSNSVKDIRVSRLSYKLTVS